MRILYVVHQLLPPKHVAGTEIYTTHLARQMMERGHDVCVFFTESYGDKDQYELSEGEFEGIPYFEAVHNYQHATFEQTYRDPRMEELFEHVLDKTRPDLVHCQHLHLHSIGYIDQIKARGLPIVYTLHEYLLMCPHAGQLLRPGLELCAGPTAEDCATCVAQPPTAIQTRTTEIQARLARVDLFVSPSAFLRQRFIDAGWLRADRIIHSDNGFFVDAFASVERTTADRLRVGYIGTLADYKGVHVLIDACAGLEDSDVECHIFGDLEMFPEYGQRLREMPKPAHVHLHGRFENRDVGQVLANLDVLVIPSLWFENSPLTIHEAFLAGLPVLASDQGGMAELVEDGVSGLHFRRGDPDDLRAKIRRLLDEPGLLQRLAADLPSVKSIAQDAADTEERYRSLLSSR